jgi:hypothetical protein
MKLGLGITSITKRIDARTTMKRIILLSLVLKAPRKKGWITNPKFAL